MTNKELVFDTLDSYFLENYGLNVDYLRERILDVISIEWRNENGGNGTSLL